MSPDLSGPGPDAPEVELAGDTNVVSVAKGAGFIALGRVFSFGLRFVMAVLVARWLGVDQYGLYVLAISIAGATASLASLGLDAAMERYLAVQVRRRDQPGARGTLHVGVAGTVVTSAILGLALFVFAEPLAADVFDDARLGPLLRVAGGVAPLIAMSTLLVASIRGFKRMDLSAFSDDFVQPVSRFVFLMVAAAAGISAYRAELAYGASYAVTIVVVLVLLRARLPHWNRWRNARRDVRDIGAFSFPFWFSGLMRLLRTRFQPLLLGIFGSAANVGVFSVVTSANTLGRVANHAISTASRPTLAELHDAGDVAQLGRLYATTTRWTLTANLPVFLVMVLVPTSLLAVFGESFTDDGLTPLVIVAVAEVVNAATGMCGPIIAMSDHNRLKLLNSFAWMAISLGANVALIPRWGVIGAAVAVLISTSAVNVLRVVELWVLLRVLPWDRRLWKPLAAAVATAALGYLVVSLLPDRLALLPLAAVVTGTIAVFAGFVVALGLEPDDLLLWRRLRRRATRRGGHTGRVVAEEPPSVSAT